MPVPAGGAGDAAAAVCIAASTAFLAGISEFSPGIAVRRRLGRRIRPGRRIEVRRARQVASPLRHG
jgi:hypothetical protein